MPLDSIFKDIDKLYVKYWTTGRSNNENLRLTKQGYNAFKDAGLQEYTYTIVTPRLAQRLNNITSQKLILLMGKLFKCPWYMSIGTIVPMIQLSVFDSKTAMIINLFGNIEDYLAAKL